MTCGASGPNPAAQNPLLATGALQSYVRGFLERRETFVQLVQRHGSPLYVLEPDVLRRRAREFTATFAAVLPDIRVFYAVKSNTFPEIMRTLSSEGLGLDVSSGRELEWALACGSEVEIIFSGPGKTEAELIAAAVHNDQVTVLIDSRGELARLEQTGAALGRRVRAGVRLTTEEHGLWRKFGIPLATLPDFLVESERCSHVDLHGLQFHSSWNLDPSRQVAFLERIGETLALLTPSHKSALEFIDIGGGFWPPRGEWLHAADGSAARPDPPLRHYLHPAQPLETFAAEIARAIEAAIFPHLRCRICFEPGRWLCNDAMHILVTVVDKKAADLLIVDAGTNAIGWERFESDYFPVINLTRPGVTEHAADILGSLCTPHDVWGYAYFGDGIEPGDILLVPAQGAYTYSLRQDFIKPLPQAVVLT